jgi:vacuolar-type H+-ATPase subunit D/Vma8
MALVFSESWKLHFQKSLEYSFFSVFIGCFLLNGPRHWRRSAMGSSLRVKSRVLTANYKSGNSYVSSKSSSQVKFNDYAKNIAETKATMAADAASAFFSMTQAEYAAGNFKQKATEGQLTARIRVGAGIDNVAGVKLPVFSKYDTGVAADNQSLGLVGGGKKIVAVREKFTVLLELLLK